MFRPEGLEDTGPGRVAAMRNFTRVRDRLFYALFYKISQTYARMFPPFVRRCFEFIVLFKALLAIGFLMYMHVAFSNAPVSCLDKVQVSWPRQDGVLRIEVVHNLNTSAVLLTPVPTPDIKSNPLHSRDLPVYTVEPIYDLYGISTMAVPENENSTECPLYRPPTMTRYYSKRLMSRKRRMMDVVVDNSRRDSSSDDSLEAERRDAQDAGVGGQPPDLIFEYALEYGFLRLSNEVRNKLGVKVTTLRIDPEKDSCFGHGLDKYIRSEIVGIEDLLRNSFKLLANKEDNKHGYLRNVKTDEHFKFISVHTTRSSYIAAAFVMVLFTLSISMLLRYSHHQIFVFIINVLQMLEMNVGMVFPAAPLLTVILALVGIEAIMSEFFSDSTTAFYIIIIVWVADQYEAICCHTPITKRYWLRFFYLYHFAFYAYHYRFNGQYSGLALVASWLLIQHSMLYFFHHYELPAVLHQNQLQGETGSHSRSGPGSIGLTANGGGGSNNNNNNNPASLEYIEHLLEELLPTGQPPTPPPGVSLEANNNVVPAAVERDSSSPNLLLYPVQNIILTHLMRFLQVVRIRSPSSAASAVSSSSHSPDNTSESVPQLLEYGAGAGVHSAGITQGVRSIFNEIWSDRAPTVGTQNVEITNSPIELNVAADGVSATALLVEESVSQMI